MPVLRPITDAEFSAWLSQAVPAYAEDKVISGAWPQEGALETSLKEHEALLPNGKDTPNNHLYTILDSSRTQVGVIWFAAEDRGSNRVAYVYNILVWPEYRRQGHALRAFAALEDVVLRMGLVGIALHVFGHNAPAQALYAKLGFKPTNFNLYKPLGVAGA